MKLRDLALRLECRLDGDGELDVQRVAGIQDAGPGDVTFLANPKYERALPATRASAVILREDAAPAPCAMLRTSDPYLAFARAVGLFAPPSRPAAGVHPLASIAAGARLGRDVSIGPFVVLLVIARSSCRTSRWVLAPGLAPTV
jgi:UDP-3-O-[3-hydroxymyristoyl] glucosamine N-acyltransferase